MNIPPPVPLFQPETRKKNSCLTCLIIFGAGVVCLACVIFLVPALLRAMGIFGRSAQYVYQQAPDLVAGQQLSEVINEREIEGVSVYVIPIMNTEEKGTFIILDSSKGYSGLSPLENDNEVFFDLLCDLVSRDKEENLRIAHLTVEYRDEQAGPFLSFTVAQEDVEKYVSGTITSDEFYGLVDFNTVDTLKSLGLDELLNEEQP
jgi:hypothetical protein